MVTPLVCCTRSLIYGLIPPQVVASLVSCGRGGVELQMKQPSNRQCVCCAYYQTQAGKGSNLWWVTLQRPLLTFGFSKWSTCTCGFIKYKLNQSRKKLQIILETAVALFWYQCHASILLICSIVAFNLNLWCVIFFRGCGQKEHQTTNTTVVYQSEEFSPTLLIWPQLEITLYCRLSICSCIDYDWDEQALL